MLLTPLPTAHSHTITENMQLKYLTAYCHLGVATWLAMGGAISTSGDCALAQITPDSTLGAESSVVTPTNIDGRTTERIDGGATRGANLFHSFEKFSVPTGGAAYFNNAANIQNIFSRVTGTSVSNIDGLLRANSTANLFLLNPNGIIFGPNASLNIGGSFLASTASQLNFADGTNFSATPHSTTPLLTVSVPIGLQYGGNAGSIQNLSQASNSSGERVGLQVQQGFTLALLGGDVRLEGGRLQALGGHVELGGLASPGSIGLNMNANQWSLIFPDGVGRADVYLTNLGSNTARVNVAASNAGSIAITARNIDISSSGTVLRGGIERNLGFLGATAGDIKLNATEAINVANSFITNLVSTGAVGNGGGINIQTGSLSVTNGAQLQSLTRGQGNAGGVTITASGPVSFDGVDSNGYSSAVFSTVESGAVGNGGSINIKAESLSLTDGVNIQTLVRGASDARKLRAGYGNAGNVYIDVRDAVTIAGVNRKYGYFSGVVSSVNFGTGGDAGNIDIKAGSLSLTDGGTLSADTIGQGGGGDINLDVKGAILLTGGSTARDTGESTRITLGVLPRGIGSGGNLNIKAGSLVLTDGAIIKNSTQGQGNAGNIYVKADVVDISGSVPSNGLPSGLFTSTTSNGRAGNIIFFDTRTFRVADGAALSALTKGEGQGGDISVNATSSFEAVNGGQIVTTTFGQGQAGNIFLNATERVIVSGSDPNYANRIAKFPSPISPYVANAIRETGAASGLFASVGPGGVSNGGNIDIKAGSLSVTNGARLNASTSGQGNAGSVNINARERASFDGVGSNGLPSAALSNVEENAIGNAGDINIKAGSLLVTNGAQLESRTRGRGNARSVNINAREEVTFDGASSNGWFSGAYSSVESGAVGNGGGINITTGSLLVTNGAGLSASSAASSGAAGNIEVSASSIRLNNQAFLSSNTVAGQGNIILRSQDLVLRKGSNITTNAAGSATGGNISIDTDILVALENSDIRATAQDAFGGRVTINSQGIFGTAFRNQLTPLSDITASSNLGPKFSGTVEINTPNIDPSHGLIDLPAEVVDFTGLIAQGCPGGGIVGRGESKFIVTGRGGLPPNPREPLRSDAVRVSLDKPIPGKENRATAETATNPTSAEPAPLVEAQGWVINNKGEIVLIAHAPNVTPNVPWMTPATCHSSTSG